MGQHEKLLAKARRNPNNLSFSDFQTLLKRLGWQMDHQTGSHQIWYSSDGIRISIQNKNGLAKGYQVKQFLNYCKEEI